MKLAELTKELKLRPRDTETILKGLQMHGLTPASALTTEQEQLLRAVQRFKVEHAKERYTWARAVSEYVAAHPEDAQTAEAQAHVAEQAAQAQQVANNGHSATPQPEPELPLEQDPHHQVQEEADSSGSSAITGVVSDMLDHIDRTSTDLAEGAVAALYQATALKMSAPEVQNSPRVQAAREGFKAVFLGGTTTDRPLAHRLPSQASRLTALPGTVGNLNALKSQSVLGSEQVSVTTKHAATP